VLQSLSEVMAATREQHQQQHLQRHATRARASAESADAAAAGWGAEGGQQQPGQSPQGSSGMLMRLAPSVLRRRDGAMGGLSEGRSQQAAGAGNSVGGMLLPPSATRQAAHNRPPTPDRCARKLPVPVWAAGAQHTHVLRPRVCVVNLPRAMPCVRLLNLQPASCCAVCLQAARTQL
jgi:hypothetical protein